MIFETPRLYVTKWEEGHLPLLYDLFNDPGIKELVLPYLTIEETTAIFQKQILAYEGHFPFGRYFIVEKVSLRHIGLFMLRENKGGIEIGYTLKKNDWNKGFATEIVRQGIEWIEDLQRFNHIYAITDPQNAGSQHVLLKSGFDRLDNFIENQKEMSLFCKLLS